MLSRGRVRLFRLQLRSAVGAAGGGEGNLRTAIRALLRRGCGGGRRRAAQLVGLLYEQEHGKGHDQEVDDGVQENAIVERRRPGGFGGCYGVKVAAGKVKKQV